MQGETIKVSSTH